MIQTSQPKHNPAVTFMAIAVGTLALVIVGLIGLDLLGAMAEASKPTVRQCINEPVSENWSEC